MRRAKIVATLGPATSSYENIRAIIEAGVDVARMNLSHGSYDVHEEIYRTVRKAASDLDKPVGIFVDLQGPKIRLARFKDGPVMLRRVPHSKLQSTKSKATRPFVEPLTRVSAVTLSLAMFY